MDQPTTPAPHSPELGDAAAVPADDLPPDVDAAVRRLLAALPDPGPMPTPVAGRVGAALAEAARLRIEPGPLSALPEPQWGPMSGPLSETGSTAPPGTAAERDAAVLAPLIARRQRPRPVLALAAVAAAAALVAVGGSALHLTKRPLGAASLGNPGFTTVATNGPRSTPSDTLGSSDPDLHIQLSRTAYDAASLPTLARELVNQPDAPVPVLAAEAPLLGPIATEVGLRSCLAELGVPPDADVHADLASYEGEPAAVIMTSLRGRATAYVVGRECSTGRSALVAGPTPVP